MTLPSITTPLPSMKATRERPSQFLKVSHTSGCCGWKLHCAISLDFKEWGSSIFFATGLFPHLPLQRADPASGAAASHKANRRIADLDLVRDVEHLDLRVKLPRLAQGSVLLVNHYIA